jgi:hypothetical protein
MVLCFGITYSSQINSINGYSDCLRNKKIDSPYICAYNFHLISTHMHTHSNFDGVSPTK